MQVCRDGMGWDGAEHGWVGWSGEGGRGWGWGWNWLGSVSMSGSDVLYAWKQAGGLSGRRYAV